MRYKQSEVGTEYPHYYGGYLPRLIDEKIYETLIFYYTRREGLATYVCTIFNYFRINERPTYESVENTRLAPMVLLLPR